MGKCGLPRYFATFLSLSAVLLGTGVLPFPILRMEVEATSAHCSAFRATRPLDSQVGSSENGALLPKYSQDHFSGQMMGSNPDSRGYLRVAISACASTASSAQVPLPKPSEELRSSAPRLPVLTHTSTASSAQVLLQKPSEELRSSAPWLPVLTHTSTASSARVLCKSPLKSCAHLPLGFLY